MTIILSTIESTPFAMRVGDNRAIDLVEGEGVGVGIPVETQRVE